MIATCRLYIVYRYDDVPLVGSLTLVGLVKQKAPFRNSRHPCVINISVINVGHGYN